MQETEYLHDSTLINVQYDTSVPNRRELTLTIKYDYDTGQPDLDGRTLCIRAVDVLVLSYTAWGYVSGEETIARWDPRISDNTISELKELQKMGIPIPETQVTVTFHSGSVLEFVCRKLRIDKIPE